MKGKVKHIFSTEEKKELAEFIVSTATDIDKKDIEIATINGHLKTAKSERDGLVNDIQITARKYKEGYEWRDSDPDIFQKVDKEEESTILEPEEVISSNEPVEAEYEEYEPEEADYNLLQLAEANEVEEEGVGV